MKKTILLLLIICNALFLYAQSNSQSNNYIEKSLLTQMIDDDIQFESEQFNYFSKKLSNSRAGKTVGILLTFLGPTVAYLAIEDEETAYYVASGTVLVGSFLWIMNPTRHLAYQRDLSKRRIEHLKKRRNQVALQIKCGNGLGLCLRF